MVGSRQAKDALFDGLASVARALGNGRRAEIVDVLVQGERRVDELAGEIGQSVANTSQHLQVLLRAGLVTPRRDGTRVYYTLAGPAVAELWTAVRGVAEGYGTEIDELATAYLGDRSGLETISREQLAEPGRAPATSSSSTCGRCPSSPPGTCPVPSTCRPPSWTAGSTSSPTVSRWSPTAEGRTASTPTRPCAGWPPVGSQRCAWSTGCPSGPPPVCRSRSATTRTAATQTA